MSIIKDRKVSYLFSRRGRKLDVSIGYYQEDWERSLGGYMKRYDCRGEVVGTINVESFLHDGYT